MKTKKERKMAQKKWEVWRDKYQRVAKELSEKEQSYDNLLKTCDDLVVELARSHSANAAMVAEQNEIVKSLETLSTAVNTFMGKVKR